MLKRNYCVFPSILLFLVLVVLGVTAKEGKFPSPAGPFYGIPFKGNLLLNFIPFTLTGHCAANKTFVLTSVADFTKHLYDLECIYAGSRIPSKIPQGSLFGTCLTFMNSPILNPIIEAVWKGKYIEEQVCNGQPIFVGWNAVLNGPTMPFIPRIGRHNLTVAPAENDDGRGGLVVEYSNDVMQMCQELREDIRTKVGDGGVSYANIWSKNIPFMDVIRFVGKQEDGGNLYLLKTYLRDAFREDKMAVTTAFTVMLNYDEEAEPGAYFRMATEPLSKGFDYMFPGLMDMLLRGLPLDNLLLTPSRTLTQIRKESETTKRNVRAFLRDLPRSFRRIVRNGFDWMRQFRDIEAQKRPINVENMQE